MPRRETRKVTAATSCFGGEAGLCDKSENMRGHRGDVSASLLLGRNSGWMGARHSWC